jgi:hypothetical protein
MQSCNHTLLETIHVLVTNLLRAFPSEDVPRDYVATAKLARVLMLIVLRVPPGTYMYE